MVDCQKSHVAEDQWVDEKKSMASVLVWNQQKLGWFNDKKKTSVHHQIQFFLGGNAVYPLVN